jgi:hypothetical protein
MCVHKLSQDWLRRYFRWAIRCWIVGLVFISACLGYSNSQADSANLQSLVRQVVENELQARKEPICWRYFSQVREEDESRTDIVIETRKGTLKRMLAQNDLPLAQKQRQQEDVRIGALIRNPRDLEEEAHKEKDDLQKTWSLFKFLPDALLYTREPSDGQMIRLSFRPNPNFNPPTLEARIFRVLQGSILVDGGQKRLIELRAVMSRDLEFVWGIFGKLRKGGSLDLRQEQIEPGCWVMTSLNVQVTGRAWFFKTIGRQIHELRWAFQRVPDNLTLEDAAVMAKREAPDAKPEKPASYNPI